MTETRLPIKSVVTRFGIHPSSSSQWDSLLPKVCNLLPFVVVVVVVVVVVAVDDDDDDDDDDDNEESLFVLRCDRGTMSRYPSRILSNRRSIGEYDP